MNPLTEMAKERASRWNQLNFCDESGDAQVKITAEAALGCKVLSYIGGIRCLEGEVIQHTLISIA